VFGRRRIGDDVDCRGGSLSSDGARFCEHYNGVLLDALNAMGEGAARDVQPTLDALDTAAAALREDAKSNDKQVKTFAEQLLAVPDRRENISSTTSWAT
jgi:hypothetical protein